MFGLLQEETVEESLQFILNSRMIIIGRMIASNGISTIVVKKLMLLVVTAVSNYCSFVQGNAYYLQIIIL